MGQQSFLLLPLLLFFIQKVPCYTIISEQAPISNRLSGALANNKSSEFSFFSMMDRKVHETQCSYERFTMNCCDEERSPRVDGPMQYSPVGSPMSCPRVVNVDRHGAKGDGVHDDTEAFKKAWKVACSSHASVVLLVPENKTYLLRPIIFSGPCKSDVTVMIKGTLEASSNRSDWDDHNRGHWIRFSNMKDLVVRGEGSLNGKGYIWWQNSCKINPSLPCVCAPTALIFDSCKDLRVEELRVKDSQQIHVTFDGCNNVKASKLTITAPDWSPNTDGIHVANTKNVLIADSLVRTGDDCISIVDGSQHVVARNIVCGPGHGISIGSLGKNKSEANVSMVLVDRVILRNTTNGVRIKTWQGGRGYAKNIIFQNISMRDVYYPIIIDQNYCDSKTPCHEQKSAVEVGCVIYKNIKGTSSSKVSMKFDCSKTTPCYEILLQDVILVGVDGMVTKGLYNNVNYTAIGKIVPPLCP